MPVFERDDYEWNYRSPAAFERIGYGSPSCVKRRTGPGSKSRFGEIRANKLRGRLMSAIFESATNINKLVWECKHCHQPISEHDTVAYHLIDGILYGWCPNCFSQRAPANTIAAELSAAAA